MYHRRPFQDKSMSVLKSKDSAGAGLYGCGATSTTQSCGHAMCYIAWYTTVIYADSQLWIPASKAMAVQIKLVTTSLGSAIIVLTFPLQRSERSQMPPVSARHKVVGQDLIEFPNRPLILSHGRNLQLCTHVVTNPLGKFRRQPAKNGTPCAIVVGDPYSTC